MTSPSSSPLPTERVRTAACSRNLWGTRPWLALLAALVLAVPSLVLAVPSLVFAGPPKLDPELARRAVRPGSRTSPVIVRVQAGAVLPAVLQRYVRGPQLRLIDGYVLDLPDAALASLDALPQVASAHQDRAIWAADYLSTRATGAFVARQSLGYTGAGIGVAVIDSGIASWHDDLTAADGQRYPYGDQRVSRFVDFVNGRTQPYDDHGHGTHVAGIILGNGYDSRGRQAGMAPDASLVSLKVLDADGRGTISHVIAALDWIAANGRAHNIRVVNLSVGAAVTQSYWIDPLTLAAKRLAERGILVVAAAGNLGRNAEGEPQYGGILAPGNAPWVLTVGASSTNGTVRQHDDALAAFSSFGPTRGDYLAKPDVVAPGHGILSLAAPGSALVAANAEFLVEGRVDTPNPPYLSLSGTSMSAAQVSGIAALMLQANPRLTPNLVKAILQYTAQRLDGYSALQQGGGFVDARGAVDLARFYAQNRRGTRLPVARTWSQRIIWGNQEIGGGYINPLASAWAENIVWGTAASDAGNIVWGTLCNRCDNIVWGTADARGENIVWGTAREADNIVWGTARLADNIVWGTSGGTAENVVWGTACDGGNCANIVWGTVSADNIVWGTVGATENIVWGTAREAENIVWGTLSADNIVWGTAGLDAGNIVWGTLSAAENIVWGTAREAENIVWGTVSADNIVWGTASNIVWGTVDQAGNVLWDAASAGDTTAPRSKASRQVGN